MSSQTRPFSKKKNHRFSTLLLIPPHPPFPPPILNYLYNQAPPPPPPPEVKSGAGVVNPCVRGHRPGVGSGVTSVLPSSLLQTRGGVGGETRSPAAAAIPEPCVRACARGCGLRVGEGRGMERMRASSLEHMMSKGFLHVSVWETTTMSQSCQRFSGCQTCVPSSPIIRMFNRNCCKF